MLKKEFEARAPEIIKKTVEFADLLDGCNAENWGDAIYVDDHSDMVDILLQIIISASCIACNLGNWKNEGQSEKAADPSADSPRPVARLELKTA